MAAIVVGVLGLLDTPDGQTLVAFFDAVVRATMVVGLLVLGAGGVFKLREMLAR